jgi:NAD(P)-dependent dehydrogenase (short-subunit alcohol dehydrogenase family)
MDISNLFDVRGRTALVTGGSLGIGAMIAEGLVRAGAKVWICSRKAANIAATCDRLSEWGICRALAADLSHDAGIAAVSESLDGQPLDILVNNAGASWAAPVEAYPRAGFDKVLNLNVTAPFFLIQRLLPNLRRAASPDTPARIINIASIDGLRPPALDSFAYSASKAGMIMLTRHLARVLAADDITVNAIAPGIFQSKMTEFWFDENHPAHVARPSIPLGDRPGTAEDIAGAVLYLASRAGRHVTGATLPVSGGEATID